MVCSSTRHRSSVIPATADRPPVGGVDQVVAQDNLLVIVWPHAVVGQQHAKAPVVAQRGDEVAARASRAECRTDAALDFWRQIGTNAQRYLVMSLNSRTASATPMPPFVTACSRQWSMCS